MAPKIKILIADGNARNHPVFERGLKGFELVFAPSGPEAVTLMQETGFALLIIDNGLSGMTSLDLLGESRRLSGNTLPAILIVNDGEEKTAIAAKKAGASDYLNRHELESPILPMAVMRALEHKKWEQVYWNLSENQISSYLKDPLTSVYNKHYFNTRLAEERRRSRRYDFPLTMSLFHIDQFFEMNKKYGKKTAEQILKDVAQYLVRDIRGSDLLARLDNDRFVLLQPHTKLDEARATWERLLNNLANHPFTAGGKNFSVTLHVAMTSLNREIEEIDRLIKSMDEYVEENGENASRLLLYAPEGS
ncbi:MAG: diguanylate cyclase [Deltaproteobacteria bacterium]|nr:diguanylate cyclase [Deltaproteobacteria bacterium]